MEPTPEQSSILSALLDRPDNLCIRALAGAGKTSTLGLLESASPVKPILCLAFNKAIAEEMTSRFSSTTTVRTFNSLGHRIWSQAQSRHLTLDPKKTQTLLKAAISDLKPSDRKEANESFTEITSAVAMAKAIGYVPEGQFRAAKRLTDRAGWQSSLEERLSPFATSLAGRVLTSSIHAAYAGNIDYNDQLYMPALFGGTFPRYPLVFVDEAQDLSPVNHFVLQKLKGSRLCVVGDPWQSIYGFRGAISSGMTTLATQHKMLSLDLSVSFRCPEAVVRAVHWHVPHMKWSKPGGTFQTLPSLTGSSIPDNSTFICRNNAPLLRLALSFLTNGRACSVAGSDIGPKLVNTMRKLATSVKTTGDLLAAINGWEDSKLTAGSTVAQDFAECMRLFTSKAKSPTEAILLVERIFSTKGSITLLTGHKAKGLEYPIVYHLDPHLIGTTQQENNLSYVISTRSSDQLYEIESKRITF